MADDVFLAIPAGPACQAGFFVTAARRSVSGLQLGKAKSVAVISGDMTSVWQQVWSQVAAGLRNPFRQNEPTSTHTIAPVTIQVTSLSLLDKLSSPASLIAIQRAIAAPYSTDGRYAMCEMQENQDTDSDKRSVAAAVFVLIIVFGCMALIFAAMYLALGITGLAIVALIAGYALLEGVGVWLLESIWRVVSAFASMLNKKGLNPELPKLSEQTQKRIKRAVLVTIFAATVWHTGKMLMQD